MRILWNLLLIGGAIYFGFALLLFLFQTRLVYLPNIPGRELSATPEHIGLDYESVSITTKDGVRLHGWLIPAGQPRGSLLFFHGNAGNISHRLDSLAIFNELGLDTLIFDYRGYGRSQGAPSEQGIYKDAEAALAYLIQERGIAQQDIIYFGRSLGGAVAAWLAARHPPGALILESSFTSAPAMAAELYPWYPARLLTRIDYNTLENIRKVSSPVLIIHSRNDEIIPFSHGQRLFEAANQPKQFLEIQGDHNAGFLISRDRYESGIDAFLNAHFKEGNLSSVPKGGP